jgi:D-alanyl-lipoteichoic acid acyltransferase DltB (MBOAT superfamily)
VAGPIVRAKSLLPQLKYDHDVNWKRIAGAIEMIAWGFFLKLCLADTLAMEVGPKFDSPDGYGALSHMMSAVFFSFQIYGDFAGYSLIAIGLGRVMGFDFGINFNRPYFSKSFNEFWQRWHISLSSWLRDYLYIPLGGNRNGTINTARNLVIVMFLGGLWHGAAWTFIIWGMLHGVYLVLQNIVKNYVMPVIARWGYVKEILPALSIVIVFFLTVIAWIFFRAKDVGTAWDIITIIFTGKNIYSSIVENKFVFLKGIFFILITLAVDLLSMNGRVMNYYYSNTYLRAGCFIVLLWTISFLGTFNESIFIYFQF